MKWWEEFKKIFKNSVSCVGARLSKQTRKRQREAAPEVDDRCDVKKTAKERPIKTNGFIKAKRGQSKREKAVKK